MTTGANRERESNIFDDAIKRPDRAFAFAEIDAKEVGTQSYFQGAH